jgi:ABC-2 type transport system permease protein
VFYDNRVVTASSSKRTDGQYDVTIEYSAAKRESDGEGRESPAKLDDWMQVGVFARPKGAEEAQEKPLYLRAHHITQESGTISVVVADEPYEVGLDPYNKLIDRIPIDNRKTVD